MHKGPLHQIMYVSFKDKVRTWSDRVAMVPELYDFLLMFVPNSPIGTRLLVK